MSRRALVFTVVAGLCVAVSVAWVAAAALSDSETRGEGGGDVGSPGGRTVVFQHISQDPRENALIAVAEGKKPRRLTNLRCERVFFGGERGLCLMPDRRAVGWGYDAKIFGPTFRVLETISLPGLISRTRVSSDGRFGATTGFVAGHSYADDSFSTATFILDLGRGTKIANLEEFSIRHNGRVVTARDRNFWGVTFTRDSDRFFATMATGGKPYLIEASVASRSGKTIREGVECPSLSPDGTRIAFKRRVQNGWRLSVLDLETLEETATAETRPVDDQPEWLDDERVLYGLEGATWVVPADGSGRPEKFLEDALSPAVVR